MDNPFLAPGGAVGNVVLDLDGVVFLGPDPIPGAGPAMQQLDDRGWRLVFATNNATRTRSFLAERLERQTGYVPDPVRIVTSAMAAAAMLTRRDDPVLFVGETGLGEAIRERGHAITADGAAARSVVVGLDRAFTYERLRSASMAIRGGARFIATNTDVTFPTPEGQVPGAGALVAAVAAAAGRQPEKAGKPHAPMIAAIRQVLGPGDTWMVGDRPETDLALAHAAGWHSVLTLSGVTDDPRAVPDDWAPDLVVGSLGELVGLSR